MGVSQKGQKKALDLSVQSDGKSKNKENSNENKPKKRRTLQLPGNILPSEGILQELLSCLCHLAIATEEEVVTQVEHLNEH